ncbi:MAG: T9SS type A sorting domain-containing protein [Saprospiraceae bacterium]|nr:T9SS type A sorting domain-containing protein [Saprospiraceae bacterium]
MKPFHLFSLILACLSFAAATAQPHTDCDNPMLLTYMNPVTIDSTLGEGVADDLTGTCLAQEFSSTWFSWQIEQPGTLTFVLTPLHEYDDLDFAVFRFNDNILCQEKVLKRCMAAGETVGAPFEQNLPCWGPTGLNLTETDLEEQPGCSNGNNNFLKFLQCQAGENYAMVVINFSQTNQGFTLEWGGTATFSPSPDSINSPSLERLAPKLSIAPNPSSGALRVLGLNAANEGFAYRIADGCGRVVRTGKMTSGEPSLDVSNLTDGVYSIAFLMGEEQAVCRFVKLGGH